MINWVRNGKGNWEWDGYLYDKLKYFIRIGSGKIWLYKQGNVLPIAECYHINGVLEIDELQAKAHDELIWDRKEKIKDILS
jgi:hypothetical protein